jgi:ParB family chromosome partitioning protein
MAPQPPRRKSPQRLSALFSGPVSDSAIAAQDASQNPADGGDRPDLDPTTLANLGRVDLGDGAIAQAIPLDRIDLPARQPRRYFDPDALDRLTASVKLHGVLEPVLVRPLDGDRYELVAGERRYRAAQAANLTQIPAISRPLADGDVLQIALIENLLREDLNPVEETEGILEVLALRLGSTPADAAALLQRMDADRRRGSDNVMGQPEATIAIAVFDALGRMGWRSFVANRLPLLALPPEILDALRQGHLSYTKAQAIARVADPAQRRQLLTWAIEQQPSLSAIRTAIARSRPSPPPPREIPSERALRDRWRTLIQRANDAKIWSDPQCQAPLAQLLTALETLLDEP